MFAIVKVKDRQFKVWTGDFLRAPFMGDAPPAEAKPEASSASKKSLISLPILAMQDSSGCLISSEQLKGASVKVRVAGHGLAKKELVFKKKRRKGYRRTKGHRQKFTELQVVEISAPSGKTFSLEKKPASGKAKKQPEKASAAASTPAASAAAASAPALKPAPALTGLKSKSGGGKAGETAVKNEQKTAGAGSQTENKQKKAASLEENNRPKK